MEILIRAQLVDAGCGTVAAPLVWPSGLFLTPGQHPTPGEGKEGGGVVAPLLPGYRQIKQLLRRGDPVASDGGIAARHPDIQLLDRRRTLRPDPASHS